MTKREFIKRLHDASPKFTRDVDAFNKLVTSLESATLAESDKIRDAISVHLKDLQKNWPRSRDFMDWPAFSKWADWSQGSEDVSDLRALFADVTFGRAKLHGIEIDPWLMSRKSSKETMTALAGEQAEEFSLEKLFNDEAGVRAWKKELRQNAGENLFSKAPIVIPIYPETSASDIRKAWGTVQRLKRMVYGPSYRPRDAYETVRKVFERGQLLEEEQTYKSWQEVAESVGLGLSTVRYIYDRAHQLVYGRPATKRPYRTEADITVPTSPDEIPENPGPSLKGKLTNIDEIDKFRNIFAEMEEDEQRTCFNCRGTVSCSSGEDILPHHYAKLRKYRSLPDYPAGNAAFLCKECLLEIVSSSET